MIIDLYLIKIIPPNRFLVPVLLNEDPLSQILTHLSSKNNINTGFGQGVTMPSLYDNWDRLQQIQVTPSP